MAQQIEVIFSVLCCAASFASAQIVQNLTCDFNDGNLCHYSGNPEIVAEEWTFEDSSHERVSNAFDGPQKGAVNTGLFLQHAGGRDTFEKESVEQGKGMILSPMTHLSGKYCLSLDYFVLGQGSGILMQAIDQSLMVEGVESPMFSESGHYLFFRNELSSNADEWERYANTINFNESDYMIALVASGASAIDNLKFTQGPCPVSEPLFCDFDGQDRAKASEICDWLHPVSHAGLLEWKVLLGVDKSTARRGSLLSAEYSKEDQELSASSMAVIKLDDMRPEDGHRCLSFWAVIGKDFRITILESALDGNVSNLLLETNEHDSEHAKGWVYKEVNIDPVVPISITINAIAQHSQGYHDKMIGLDDFKLAKGKCQTKPGNCDFSKSTCGFDVTSMSNIWTGSGYFRQPSMLRWYRGSGRARSPRQFRRQHANDHEKFIYVDFTDRNPMSGDDNQGFVISDLIPEPGTYCLRMDYHVARMNHFQVLITPEIRVFNLTNVQNGKWSTGFTDITAPGPFRFTIAFELKGEQTVLEIRRIRLDAEACSKVAAKEARNQTRYFDNVDFNCYQSGHHIPQYRACDGVTDCPMGEDEGDHCGGNECAEKGFACSRRGHKFCLSTSEVCNGDKNCDDGSDQDPRLCSEEAFCANYCLNGGDCSSDPDFKCRCADGFSGKRCQLRTSEIC